MFVGTDLHTVNKDGRLSIPAKMRDVIKKEYNPKELYLVIMPGNILCLYPDLEFERLTARLDNPQGAPLSEIMEMERVCANAESCSLDGSGRIVIPPEMRQRAKIDQNVLVFGARSHIEIWAPDHWDWYQEQKRSGGDRWVAWPAHSNGSSQAT